MINVYLAHMVYMSGFVESITYIARIVFVRHKKKSPTLGRIGLINLTSGEVSVILKLLQRVGETLSDMILQESNMR